MVEETTQDTGLAMRVVSYVGYGIVGELNALETKYGGHQQCLHETFGADVIRMMYRGLKFLRIPSTGEINISDLEKKVEQ